MLEILLLLMRVVTNVLGCEAGREVIIARPSSENGPLMLKIPRLPSALGGRFLG